MLVKALHGFGNRLKMRKLADRVPPSQYGLRTQNLQASTDCRGLLLYQVSSHFDQRFSFYHANIHTHTLTHIVTNSSQYPHRRTTSSARIIMSTAELHKSRRFLSVNRKATLLVLFSVS